MTSDSRSKLLHIEDCYKAYGSKVILDDIDLTVRSGEFCSVVGPSGCGKSTLLRLILGQELPSAGQILIDGAPVGHPSPDRGIVYQRYSLFPHLTVMQNVTLGLRLSCSYLEWLRQRSSCQAEALELLRAMRLEQDHAKYPHELSGGMQQRVAIAQALIMTPKILLMDEPFGALDPGTREDLQLYLLEAWERYQMTIFFVTHDLEEAVFLGRRVLVLSRFYSDDRTLPSGTHGAKIVADHRVPQTHSTAVKSSPEFGNLIAQIRHDGFDPEYRQHVKDFNLKHPDSWRT